MIYLRPFEAVGVFGQFSGEKRGTLSGPSQTPRLTRKTISGHQRCSWRIGGTESGGEEVISILSEAGWVWASG
jgi:hypothetical protein